MYKDHKRRAASRKSSNQYNAIRPQERLKCKLCDKFYAGKAGLKQHFRAVHNWKLCTICNIRIHGGSEELKAHVLQQHGDKKPACKECGEEFDSIFGKNEHEKNCDGTQRIDLRSTDDEEKATIVKSTELRCKRDLECNTDNYRMMDIVTDIVTDNDDLSDKKKLRKKRDIVNLIDSDDLSANVAVSNPPNTSVNEPLFGMNDTFTVSQIPFTPMPYLEADAAVEDESQVCQCLIIA